MNILSEGIIEKIFGDRALNEVGFVQILRLKQVRWSGADVYQVVLSDGRHEIGRSIAAKSLINANMLEPFAVIKLCDYTFTKNICTIKRFEHVQVETEKLGDPVKLVVGKVKVENKKMEEEGNGSDNDSHQHERKAMKSEDSDKFFRQDFITPINDLTIYAQYWNIKARVTMKSRLIHFNRTKPGCLFNVHLLDRQGGEIRATAFNDVAKKLYDIFEDGKVYAISNGGLKLSNHAYNPLPHRLEISLNNHTKIQEIEEEDAGIGHISYNFKSICDLTEMKRGGMIDIVGVVSDMTELTEFTSKKSNKEMKRRGFTLIDTSNCAVSVTLWGNDAEKYGDDIKVGETIMVLKNAMISDFNTKSLNAGDATKVLINPDLSEVKELAAWWSENKDTEHSVVSKKRQKNNYAFKTLTQAKSEHSLVMSEEVFIVKAYISKFYVSSPNSEESKAREPWYRGCPKCMKKVEVAGSLIVCPKCGNLDNSKRYYMISTILSDYTSDKTTWITLFGGRAERMMGIPADDLAKLAVDNPQEYDEKFRSLCNKEWILLCKATENTEYNQVKLQLLNFYPKDPKRESTRLIEEITSML